MSELVSVSSNGPQAARRAFERTVLGGGVALFPADTLYGLACDPSDAAAIQRIRALKGREAGKPSAVMFFSPLAMRELVSTLGPRTRDALAALLPGPVTLVIANPERLYPLACDGDPERLGVRLISGPLDGAACAVFQTSANRSGDEPPVSFAAIDPAIAGGVDLAIDGGEVGGAPSTVVDVTGIEAGGGFRILRAGALGAAAVGRRLASVLGD